MRPAADDMRATAELEAHRSVLPVEQIVRRNVGCKTNGRSLRSSLACRRSDRFETSLYGSDELRVMGYGFGEQPLEARHPKLETTML